MSKPSIFNSRVWVLAAAFFQEARTRGLTTTAARASAAFELRKLTTEAELEAAIPELKEAGSMAYGIAARALRGKKAGR